MAEQFDNPTELNTSQDSIQADDDVRSDDGIPEDGQNNIDNDIPPQENTEIYGAPENYDFSNITLPQGYKFDNDMLKEFNPIAKELNLSQKSADKLMNLAAKLVEKNYGKLPEVMEQVKTAKVTQYKQALNTDKEIFGGSKVNMDAYMDIADKGYNAFATDDVKTALNEAGLDYHPAVIKMFHRIGELVGDDKIFAPKAPVGTELDAADVLYGNKN